jgi:hypothetical protein
VRIADGNYGLPGVPALEEQSFAPGAIHYISADDTMSDVGHNLFNVNALPAPVSLVLDATANDAINVGDASHSLDPVQGHMVIFGHGPRVTLNFLGQNDTTDDQFSVYKSSIQRNDVIGGKPFLEPISPACPR